MEKLVSVILPTHNGATRIESAVRSVMSQTYANWELIVIGDGSTDNTDSVVNELIKIDPRIKYIKNEKNLGIQKTLNKGLSLARGVYIARIDDDDLWCDVDKLTKQIEFLEKNSDHVLVGTGVIVIDERGNEMFRYLLPISDKELRNKILAKNCFVHSSTVFKKDMALKFNGYDESQNTRHLEDYDLWLKLGTVGKFHNLPIYGVKFTLRKGSLSSVNKISQFKKAFNIITNFKHLYPNYFFAIVRSILRLVIYGFITKIPIKLSINRFIKFYKENW